MFNTFALLDLGTADMLIIFAIILLLFGSRKLPELARSLGTSARELKAGLGEASEASRELKQHVAEVAAAPQPAFAEADRPAEELAAAAPVSQGQNTSEVFGQSRRIVVH